MDLNTATKKLALKHSNEGIKHKLITISVLNKFGISSKRLTRKAVNPDNYCFTFFRQSRGKCRIVLNGSINCTCKLSNTSYLLGCENKSDFFFSVPREAYGSLRNCTSRPLRYFQSSPNYVPAKLLVTFAHVSRNTQV